MPNWDGPYIQSYSPSNLATPKEVTNGGTVDKIYAVSASGTFGAGEFKGGSATVPLEQRDNYPLVELGDILVAYTLNPLVGTELVRKAIVTQFLVIDVDLGVLQDGTGVITYSGPGITKELMRKVLRSPYISTKYDGTSTAYTETYIFLDAAHAETDNFYNGGVIEINGSLADIWAYVSGGNRAYVNNWRGNAPEDGNDPLDYIIHFGKATDNLDQALSYSQTGWVNTLNGGAVSGTPGGSFNVIDGRTVLDMVKVIADETGYQFRNLLDDPPARQLDWFNPQGTPISSGITIKDKGQYTEAQLYADVTKSIVISCERKTSRRDKWTRMIVATNDGLTLHGLTLGDITVPAGFSVDFDQSMVTNTAAEAGFTTPEIFEKTHIFQDISSPSDTDEAKKQTKISLFNATISKMRQKAGQYHTYNLRTVLLRDLAVGQQLYLDYTHVVGGETIYSVADNLWIRNIALSASAEDGVRYVDIELGEQYESDVSDGPGATARAIKDSRGVSGQIFFGTPSLGGGVTDHGQLLGLTDVIDHPGYLVVDGSRALIDDMAVAAGKTIDGVDISAHAADPDAHHDAATAGTHVSLSGQQISVIGTADAENNPSEILIPDSNGRFRTSGIGIGTPPEGDHLVFGANANAFGNDFQAPGASGFTRHWYLETANSDDESTLHISNLVADSMIVQVLQAESTSAFSNAIIITKSVGVVEEAFTVPSVGNTRAIIIKDNPAWGTAAVFEVNDKVVFRAYKRDSGFSLFWVGGYVTGYSDNGDGTQDWLFHCEDAGLADGAVNLTIHPGTPIIDYGVSGDPWIEIDASRDSGPNLRIGSWAGDNPWDAGNRIITGIFGDLQHLTGIQETGIFSGISDEGPHFKISDAGGKIKDIPIEMTTGTSDGGYFQIHALEFDTDIETAVAPNGDLGSTANISHGGTGAGALYTSVNEDPSIGQPDAAWLRNTYGQDAVYWSQLEDISHTLTELTLNIYLSVHNFGDDRARWDVQLFKNDGVTPLTDLMKVATNETFDNGFGGLLIIPITGIDTTASDANWANAYVKLTLTYFVAGDTPVITIDVEEGINITGHTSLNYPDDGGEFIAAEYKANALTFGEIGAPSAAIYTGADLSMLSQPLHVRAFPDPTWGQAQVWIEALTDTDGDYGRLQVYEDGMILTVDDVILASMTGNGLKLATGLTVGDDGGATAAAGSVILDQGTLDGAILSARSDDMTVGIAQGMNHTNEYFYLKKIHADQGGALLKGAGESTRGIQIIGSANTGSTTPSSSALAPFILQAQIDNGSLTGTQLALAVYNHTTGIFFIDGAGSAHTAGTHQTFDEHDDDQLCLDMNIVVSEGVITGAFNQFVDERRQRLIDLGLINEAGFRNTSLWQMLHNGTLVQHGTKLTDILQRLAKLEARSYEN